MQQQEIDNVNDRCILALLILKKDKSILDKIRIKKYKKLYPDFDRDEYFISNLLRERGFIATTNTEVELDEVGNPYYLYPDLPKVDYVTDLGLKALKSRLLISEHKEAVSEKRKTRLSNFSIVIAIIGGILGIVSFFKEQLIRLINYFF